MRRAAALAVAVCALAGCGGGRSADEVLREAAAKVGDIRSADLRLHTTLSARDGESGRVGFELRGPVELGGDLPEARLRYTQLAGDQEAVATFISTGREAFVDLQGTAYRLDGERTAALRESARGVQRGARLPVGRWFREAEVADGPRRDGEDTDRVTADLDAVAALRDIFGAAEQAGAQVPDLGGTRADDLRDAVERASAVLVAGREDALLRELRVRIDFRLDPPAALRERLRKLSGGRFEFVLELSRVNQPVRVAAPADPQPASALPAGQ